MAKKVKKAGPKAATKKKTVTKKKTTAKKVTSKKSVAKKTVAKKAVKKTTAKKAAPKKITRKAVKKAAPAKTVKPTQAKTEGLTFGVKASTNNAMENMMTQSNTQFDKIAQEAAGYSREGMEAFMKSGTIFAKGFEDLFRTSMTLAQTSAERQAQFVQEAMSVKNLNEFTDVQNKIVQANFDDFMSNATKISEMGTKLLTEAAEPLNSQVNKARKAA